MTSFVFAESAVIKRYSEADYPPYRSDMGNSNTIGFDIEFFNIMFNGYEYKIENHTNIWENIYSYMKSGKADTCGLVEVNPELEKDMLFSKPVIKAYTTISPEIHFQK
jgi:hypothetical protein